MPYFLLFIAVGVAVVFFVLWNGAKRKLTDHLDQLVHDLDKARAVAKEAQADASRERRRADDAAGRTKAAEERANTLQAHVDQMNAAVRVVDGAAKTALQQAEERAAGDMAAANEREARLQAQANELSAHVANLKRDIAALRSASGSIGHEAELFDVGVYNPVFRFPDSPAYKAALTALAERQRALVSADEAVVVTKTWALGGDVKAGAKMAKSLVKLALRAFNGEAEAAVSRVTWSNLAAMTARVERAQATINTILEPYFIQITPAYLALRLEEIRLTQEEADILHREREEQREIREQMREEEKARREAEKAKEDAEREERRASEALAAAKAELQRNHAMDTELNRARIAELEARLAAAQTGKAAATSMAQFTRLGHVYVISNIGSLGQGMVKIGMTRRLDPLDRVDELGDASVPFPFDVHAMIRTEDAPALESALHERFAERRVNLVNLRKEYFQVSLADVQRVCEELGAAVRFTMAADAADFRQSMALRTADAQGKPRIARVSKAGIEFMADMHGAGWRPCDGANSAAPPTGVWRGHFPDPLLDLVDQAVRDGWNLVHLTPVAKPVAVATPPPDLER